METPKLKKSNLKFSKPVTSTTKLIRNKSNVDKSAFKLTGKLREFNSGIELFSLGQSSYRLLRLKLANRLRC